MSRPYAATASRNDVATCDIFQWEVRSWSRALPLWEKHIPAERPLKALGIGEREGGLSLWLANKGIDVVCTDLGPLPQATYELHRRYGVSDRITYAQADATALAFADETFDLVFFKSVIGALGTKEKQLKAINEMHRVLRPGGKLLFAENLHGSRLHRWLRKRYVPWNSYWRYLDPIDDLDLSAPFKKLEDDTTGLIANFGRSEAQRDLLARIDAVLLPLVPKRQRTIWFGVGVK
jgi:SAM-dependent methyltransferase